jgi:uncharacterized membrane protein
MWEENRHLILAYAKERRNHNCWMTISYTLLCVLDLICAMLYGFRAVFAAVAGAAFGAWLALGIIWLIIGVTNTFFALCYAKMWREAKEKIKEIENE